jgi:hypothetical protein
MAVAFVGIGGRGQRPRSRPKQARTRLRAFADDKTDAFDFVFHGYPLLLSALETQRKTPKGDNILHKT